MALHNEIDYWTALNNTRSIATQRPTHAQRHDVLHSLQTVSAATGNDRMTRGKASVVPVMRLSKDG